MADIQHALLSKAILEQSLPEILSARVTEEFFKDEQYARIFRYLNDHWVKYGKVADESVVARDFPNEVWENNGQPTEYYIDQILKQHRHSMVLEAINEAANLLQKADPDNTDKIIQGFQDVVHRTNTETSGRREVDATSLSEYRDYDSLLKERSEASGDLRGITTGFDGIDKVTGGLQPEHFVVIFGLPKTMKSATLLAMASAAHQDAYSPLFIGFEMSHEEQRDRLISLRSGVDLNSLLSGNLSKPERARVDKARSRMLDMRPFHFTTDIESATTVAGIASLVQEKDPDVVYIDGIYFMQSALKEAEPGSPQALTDISRSIKRLAQRTRKPIVVTSQASQTRSRGGVLTMASGMYTQAFVQDANVILGTQRTDAKDDEEDEEETHRGPVTVKFKVLGSRSGPRTTTVLEWDWANGSVTELSKAEMDRRLNTRANPTPGTEDNEGWDN